MKGKGRLKFGPHAKEIFSAFCPPPQGRTLFFTDDPLKWEILINIAKLLERKNIKVLEQEL